MSNVTSSQALRSSPASELSQRDSGPWLAVLAALSLAIVVAVVAVVAKMSF